LNIGIIPGVISLSCRWLWGMALDEGLANPNNRYTVCIL
jgi:hypothetical protein